jgi:DNA-binding beta-propeller fold protein YncE
VWPLLVKSPDGSRVVRETLAVSHTVNAFSALDPDDIKGQLVRVFDTATGKEALTAPVTPALDAGGNVAISPSGRRVAVLNAGAIQVFELPPPAQLPESAAVQAGH